MLVFLTVRATPNHSSFTSVLGYGDMIFSFFSTISYHLEGAGNWGKRFPRLLLDLCDHGIIKNENLDEAAEELKIISWELQKFPLSDAIYDIGDLSLPIPWEVLPGAENHNLAQPWVTPRGAKSYFLVFIEKIQLAKSQNAPLLLTYPYENADPKSLFIPKQKGREYWRKDKSR